MRRFSEFLLITPLLLLCIVACTSSDKDIIIPSPNKAVELKINCTDGTYSIFYSGRKVVNVAHATLLANDDSISMKHAVIKEQGERTEYETSVLYRQREVISTYRYAIFDVTNGWQMEWRVFDDGVAYRFIASEQSLKSDAPIIVKDEILSVSFDGTPEITWAHSAGESSPFKTSFENSYSTEPLDKAGNVPAFLPASVNCGDDVRVTLVESNLKSYPGMFVVPDTSGCAINAVFAHYPATFSKYPWRDMSYVETTSDYISVSTGPRTYPWRILKLTDDDTQLPVDNLIYSLAEPLCQEAFPDGTDWIKPGFSAWEWWNDWGLENVGFKPGIDQRTYKYYIDFAARNGLEYVVLDEGWYPVNEGLLMEPVPSLDLPALVEYGRERGVRLILWAIFNSVDKQLETVMEHYSKMGIAGFKIDFLDRNDQTAVEMAWRIAESAARHKLILDYHGIFPPAGLSRTFPNVVNYEGILGLENCKWNDTEQMDHPLYDVTVPYLRGMCGYADYTPGAMKNSYRKDFKVDYSKPMSMGTRCHQAAIYITLDSPLSMFADTPTNYGKEPEYTSFIASLPRDYDEKRVLSGRIGEHIVVARRSGNDWYIAGLTNWNSRNVEIDWGFLDKGHEYIIQAITDSDDKANEYKYSETTPAKLSKIHMQSGGGFLLKVKAK